jgi:hypothetical protein
MRGHGSKRGPAAVVGAGISAPRRERNPRPALGQPPSSPGGKDDDGSGFAQAIDEF